MGWHVPICQGDEFNRQLVKVDRASAVVGRLLVVVCILRCLKGIGLLGGTVVLKGVGALRQLCARARPAALRRIV